MKNMVFVIWMIGMPFLDTICEAIEDMVTYHTGGEKKVHSDGANAFSGLLHLSIWAFVGFLLYEG